MTQSVLKAPFPYFGGKSGVAAEVWSRFGVVGNYVEPFAGSLAVLLRRPGRVVGSETVNDADGMVSNWWRAVRADPEAVANVADWPVFENDLHARHAWLVGQQKSLQARLEGDPDWFDAKVAGWWVWGLCCYIGNGWCSGRGPWRAVDGELVRACDGVIERKRIAVGHMGKGINKKLPYLDAGGRGVTKSDRRAFIFEWFEALSDRLRGVRVACGDWTRVMSPTVTLNAAVNGVFLDPPYSAAAGRRERLYACDDLDVAHAVRAWAVEHGGDRRLRIALCGYEGEHDMPSDWECLAWKTPNGGYGNQGDGGNANRFRERIWFSPHCLGVKQGLLV